MAVKVRIYSDFVCPFCFIGKDQLEKAIKETKVDVEVVWQTFELRPRPYEQLDSVKDASKQALWKQAIYPRIEAWDIDMHLPNVSPHPYTDLAHEGFYYAKEFGKENAYIDRVYNAFFQEDQNIGEIEVLGQLALEVGLDSAGFIKSLKERTCQSQRLKALDHAYTEANITGVPTFIIGNQRINGLVDKESFKEVLVSEARKAEDSAVDGMQCGIDGKSC